MKQRPLHEMTDSELEAVHALRWLQLALESIRKKRYKAATRRVLYAAQGVRNIVKNEQEIKP